jgi:hypothetical protein
MKIGNEINVIGGVAAWLSKRQYHQWLKAIL